MHFATRAIHSAQPSDPATGALVAPIYQTSTYEQESPGVNLGFDYSRTNNPTRQRLEQVLAELEGVSHCAVFASGLAAEHAVLHAYLRPHDEIIVPLDVYGGTFRLLNRVFAGFDLTVTPVDTADLGAVRAAISGRTRLVWLETPTNPRLIVSDIAAIAGIAHQHGALVVVDNTFATPVLQQPFSLGADIVVHSVTKYLAGHSDLIQGAALARDAAVFEPIKFLQNAIGAVPAPLDCWLTLRGLKTLELRVQRHGDNAHRIAEALAAHPRVKRVYYPGLANHPGHDIARKQMAGFGGMVSFELDGTIDEVTQFVSRRALFALGESLGGVKSLICHPARMTHASIPAERRAALGLSDTLIRLSPGIEHPDDLITDLLRGSGCCCAIRSGNSRRVGTKGPGPRPSLQAQVYPGREVTAQVPEGACTMRDRRFDVIGKLRGRLLKRRIPEDRIVAKPVSTGGLARDLAFDGRLGLEQDLVAARHGQRRHESRRAIAAVDAAEDLLESCRIGRRRSHEARRQHAGFAVHGVDDETRVFGDGNKSRSRRIGERLYPRVLPERAAGFNGLWNWRDVGKADEIARDAGQQRANFSKLVGIGCRD